MKLIELAGLVEENDQGKIDIAVKSSDLSINNLGELVFADKNFRPNGWGWYLLFNKASKGTTKRYMQGHPIDQWAEMLNYDLSHSDQEWVLRTREDEILGVVSGKYYRKFNNIDVVRALIDTLGENTPIHRHHLDDRFFYVRTLYPGGDFEIDGEGTYHIGFTTFNSEVGFRSLGNAAFIYKLACQNDAQLAEHTRRLFRHVGHSFEEMSGGLRKAINSGKRLKRFYVDLVRKAAGQVIEEEDFISIMSQVRKILRLSKKRADAIVELYAEEPNTKMGLINSITHYCHRLRGDQRFMLESGAGSLLEKTISGGEIITDFAA
jgi:hypothetical protein